MHQSMPAVFSPPLLPCHPGGGASVNFALPGGEAFANPRATPEGVGGGGGVGGRGVLVQLELTDA